MLRDGKAVKGIRGSLTGEGGRRIRCEYSVEPLYNEHQDVMGAIFSFSPEAFFPLRSGMSKHQLAIDYQTLFETLPEGVFTINTGWRITSFNRTAERITGYTKTDAIGRHCWDVFRSDSCRRNCPLSTSLKTGRTCMDQEMDILSNTGVRQSLRVNSSALFDRDGSILGAVETFRPSDRPGMIPIQKPEDYSCSGIIGKSSAMQAVFSMLPDIAASEANVLICGESGTGKDLLARAIHVRSKNAKGPFVSVNCMALAESLLESELFGHEKGAFTGAVRTRPGRFELAGNGTLFLDEIGEMKPELQVKLLGVLEQRVFERVGGTIGIPFKARLISATNRHLEEGLKTGRFREDLYYRLKTVPLTLPPLRERADDIPLLVDHFITKFNVKYDKNVRSVDPKAIRFFLAYHWPGNIRELERCIEHAFVFVKGPVIFARHLPDIQEFRSGSTLKEGWLPEKKESHDRETLLRALSESGGRKGPAAALLGISRTSLWRRMKSLGLT
ncbi:MAG: sigma-54 interaction domain-containing protein [Thermodesulfobacteriota bacterium]